LLVKPSSKEIEGDILPAVFAQISTRRRTSLRKISGGTDGLLYDKPREAAWKALEAIELLEKALVELIVQL